MSVKVVFHLVQKFKQEQREQFLGLWPMAVDKNIGYETQQFFCQFKEMKALNSWPSKSVELCHALR